MPAIRIKNGESEGRRKEQKKELSLIFKFRSFGRNRRQNGFPFEARREGKKKVLRSQNGFWFSAIVWK